MLRHQDSHYQAGRNQGLLKLKQFQDAEAKQMAIKVKEVSQIIK